MNGNNPPQGPAPFPQEPPKPSTPPTPPGPPQPQKQPPPSPPPPVTPPPPPVSPSMPPPAPPRPTPPPPVYSGPTGTPAQVPPPPPPPEVGVRTFASDVSSLKSSGGVGPQPKTFRPEDLGTTPVFKPQAGAAPAPVASAATPASAARLIPIIGGSVLLLLLGTAVFYFLVKPMFFGSDLDETPIVTPTPEPPAPPPPPPTPSFTHKSFFAISPPMTETLTASGTGLASLTAAIQAATASSQPAGTMKELVLASETMGSTEVLGVLLPDFDKTFIQTNLEQDFTLFVYYDKDGVWPGYIFQFKPGADLKLAKTAIAGIENSLNLTNFYLTSPGNKRTATFRDGAPIGGNPVRYLSYTKAGASFNYAVLGNYLVLSTSFGGFKEAAKLLGIQVSLTK